MMKLASKVINHVSVLEVSGNFDIYTAANVQAWLEEVLAEPSDPPVRVVIDLSGVDFIDSKALATLIKGVSTARERQGDIYLCGLKQPVRMVLELTRLDRVFEIFTHQEEAVRAFYGV